MALIFQKFLRLFRIHQVNAVIIESKQKHVNRKWTCRIFWAVWFCLSFWANCPYTRRHSNTNLTASRHIKREKASLRLMTCGLTAISPRLLRPPILERAILYLKLACFGLWLKEWGILHLKRTCFALRLIERGTLHLKRAKWLENRRLRNRGEMIS